MATAGRTLVFDRAVSRDLGGPVPVSRVAKIAWCRFFGAFIFFVGIAGVTPATTANPVVYESNTDCLRCHGMATLGYREPVAGHFIDLSVDGAAFKRSNRAELNCQDCHQPGFAGHPHDLKPDRPALHCLNCHDEGDNPKFKKYRFREIEAEFAKSVHVAALKNKMGCFSCHDPHAFEVAEKRATTREIVWGDNAICLNCHGAPVQFVQLTTTAFPDLTAGHDWLPNATLHWNTVRCIECHTRHRGRVSHEILGADKAERNCVVCHSRDSLLLAQLYRHRVGAERQTAGYLNSILLNDAYIIGATRNDVLDKLSFLLVGVVGLGIGGHAVGRYVAGRRRKERP